MSTASLSSDGRCAALDNTPGQRPQATLAVLQDVKKIYTLALKGKAPGPKVSSTLKKSWQLKTQLSYWSWVGRTRPKPRRTAHCRSQWLHNSKVPLALAMVWPPQVKRLRTTAVRTM
eukprot:1011086-Amphidinium_carterae.1